MGWFFIWMVICKGVWLDISIVGSGSFEILRVLCCELIFLRVDKYWIGYVWLCVVRVVLVLVELIVEFVFCIEW